jgi:hypothetical protein
MAKRTASGRRRAVTRPATRPGSGQTGEDGRVPSGEPRSRSSLSPDRAALEARLGFALGAMAFIALPIAYEWTFRPGSRPAGSDLLVTILELGGIVAAAAALLLGGRARAAADRSAGAVWAPRLGGAAIVGYAMVLVLLATRAT